MRGYTLKYWNADSRKFEQLGGKFERTGPLS